MGLFGDAGDGALGHARVVFQGHTRDGAAVVANDADETADTTNIGAPGRQRRNLRADVEIFVLDFNVCHWGAG